MSVFGNIMSLQDVLNRLPQFEHQINQLNRNPRDSQSSQANFVRQARDLHKQLDEHRKRAENVKTEDSFKKRQVLDQCEALKMRLLRICPEVERNSSILSSAPTSRHSIEEEEPAKAPKKSTMYADSDSLDADAEDEKQATPPPEPKKRTQIAITKNEPEIWEKPENQPKQKEEEEVEVAGNTFQVLKNLEPAKFGDLKIYEGDILEILETRNDGWWMAKNGKDEQGWVPKTYLKHFPKPKERSKLSKRLGVRDSVIATTQFLRRNTKPSVQPITTIDVSTLLPNAVTTWTGKQITCLGDAYRCDHHLTYACHLTPRLSHTNLGFHDLFWVQDLDQVRKRNIRISRLLRIVRLEGMPLTSSKAIVRLALLDESRKRGKQIVSNVVTQMPRVKGATWHLTRAESRAEDQRSLENSDIFLRSNYSLASVVLVIEASLIVATGESGFEERSLGNIKIGLLNDEGQPKVVSRTYVEVLKRENLFGISEGFGGDLEQNVERRVFFKVMDVPKDKVHFMDSMPDVLLLNSLYLPFFYYYRRRAGTLLIRDNPNPLSSEMHSDPLLSIFPEISDQHDIMDAMLQLWRAKSKITAKKSEVDQTIEFFQTFLHTAYFMFATQIMPNYEIGDDVALAGRQKVIRTFLEALKVGKLKELLAIQKCRPCNIYDYSLDLMGAHSID
ncbi:unnamed protein product [Caenorhabditis angaria]|uniref:SH3 domain-containing protein n=1 Tax=Caenorhabditis angaria TaxID=860376 RepID=A0A9P1IEI3_9PELO|nr:unnamed protein product [Caenorhabditis angaria]